MRASIAFVFAALSCLVTAQSIGNVPQCAQTCVANILMGSNCGANPQCICADNDLIAKLSCCVASGCNSEETQQVIDFANRICKVAGVSDLPTAASCPSTSAGPTQTPTGAMGTPTGTMETPTSEAGAAQSSTPPGAAARNMAEVGAGAGAIVAGLLAVL